MRASKISASFRTGKLAPIDAIGVDEIQYSKGHKYLTLAGGGYTILKDWP